MTISFPGLSRPRAILPNMVSSSTAPSSAVLEPRIRAGFQGIKSATAWAFLSLKHLNVEFNHRYLANKCSIASRIDCFSEESTTVFGSKLKEQVILVLLPK